MFPVTISPPDPNDHATMSGNSTASSSTGPYALRPRRRDPYRRLSGQRHAIPTSRSRRRRHRVANHRHDVNAGSIKVGKNQSFRRGRPLDARRHAHPQNPMVREARRRKPDNYTTNPSRPPRLRHDRHAHEYDDPQRRSRYLHPLDPGQAGSPISRRSGRPQPSRSGPSPGLQRDTSSTIAIAARRQPVTFGLKIKREGSAFNGTNVNLSLVARFRPGIGTVTFSRATSHRPTATGTPRR